MSIRKGIVSLLLNFCIGLHEVIHHTDETGDYTAISQKEDNFINEILTYLKAEIEKIEMPRKPSTLAQRNASFGFNIAKATILAKLEEK